jgi:hypothetical protein
VSAPHKVDNRRASEVKPVDLYGFVAQRLIDKISEQPIEVQLNCADGSITVQITKKDRWFKELNARRIEALRTRFHETTHQGETK